jgi:3-hydroxyacyl-CoA dehydrogenase, NAD binding domain
MSMAEESFARTAVIGTGMMGPGIALVLAQASARVALVGRSAASVARGRDRINAVLSFLVQSGLRDQGETRALGERVLVTDRPEDAVAGAGLVVESIADDLTIKQELFGYLGCRICARRRRRSRCLRIWSRMGALAWRQGVASMIGRSGARQLCGKDEMPFSP